MAMIGDFEPTLPSETEPLNESRRDDHLRWRRETLKAGHGRHVMARRLQPVAERADTVALAEVADSVAVRLSQPGEWLNLAAKGRGESRGIGGYEEFPCSWAYPLRLRMCSTANHENVVSCHPSHGCPRRTP